MFVSRSLETIFVAESVTTYWRLASYVPSVRRHADQLRFRVDDGESRAPAYNDIGDSSVPIELDGGIGEDQETETQLVVPENQETQSTEPVTPTTTDTALPAPVVTPAQELNNSE